MKKLFISILAIAALVSCSKDDVVEVNKEAISFENAFVNNSTKAATDPSLGTTSNPLNKFEVWGAVNDTQDKPVAIFAGEEVSGTVGANSEWKCTKTQYWIAGAKYNFAALVNASTVTLGEDLLPKSVTYTADGKTDLLYAKSAQYTGKAADNDLVAFSFNHLLSKAKFSVTNTIADTDYAYEVTGIKITNAIASGSCDVTGTTPAWKADPDSNNYAVEFGSSPKVTKNTTSTDSEATNEQLLIPGSYEAKIECTVNLYYKNNLISTTNYTSENAKKATVDLQPGYAYNFNISLGLTNPIQFTVTTNPTWNTAAGNVTVN